MTREEELSARAQALYAWMRRHNYRCGELAVKGGQTYRIVCENLVVRKEVLRSNWTRRGRSGNPDPFYWEVLHETYLMRLHINPKTDQLEIR